MKLKLTILFLAIASIAFAQKKEIKKIEKALAIGNFEEAKEAFNSIDENQVDEKYLPDFTFYKALNEFNNLGTYQPSLEDLNNVEGLLKKALDLGYENAQLVPMIQNGINTAKFNTAAAYANSGKVKEAYDLIKELYDIDPSNGDMLLNAADLAYQGKDFANAKKHYRELISKRYTGVKTTYKAKNNATGKEEVFNNKQLRTISIQAGNHSEPTESTSPSLLGSIVSKLMYLYKQDDELSQAQGLLKSIISDFPDDVSLKTSLPGIYTTLEMKEEFDQAVAANDELMKDPEILRNLGKNSFDAKNYKEAIDYYVKSLAIKADFNAYTMLANSYIEHANTANGTNAETRADYQGAASSLEKAFQMDRSNESVKATLINLYTALGMDDKVAKLKG